MPIKQIFTCLCIIVTFPAMAQNKMSLAQFMDKVKDQNLDLKVEDAKLNVMSERSEGAIIPPPMVGITRMKDDGLGTVAYGFEIDQTIPFPSKISRDFNTREYSIRSQTELLRAQEREMQARAKLSYVALWVAQEQHKLLLEKKQIVTEHIKLSRSTGRSDSYAGIHLLKAEADLDFLEAEMLEAVQKITTNQIEAATLLNLDPVQFKMIAEEPPQSSLPKSFVVEQSHQIQSSLIALDGIRSREQEAQAKWYPDFNLRYRQTEPTPMSSRTSEIMIGVSLPFVFFGEPASAQKTAAAERIQAEFELQKQKLDIEAERAKLVANIQSLIQQINLVMNQLIPKAEKRMKLIHNLAPRDMETLQDHRETMEALPNLKLKLLKLRLEYESAVTSLEKYIPESGAKS